MRELARELVSGLTEVDGRAWRTLRRVLTEPGSLTREYAEGRFVAQLPPIRLYLVISALFFFLAPLVGGGIVRLAGEEQGAGWVQLGPVSWDSEVLLLVLIPLFAVAARILLPGRVRAFEEVFVFSVHYQVFFLIVMTLGGAVGAMVSRLGSIWPVLVVFLITALLPFAYLVRALHVAFGLRRHRLVLLSVTLFLVHLMVGQALQNVLDGALP